MRIAVKKTVVTEVKSIPPPPANTTPTKRAFQPSDLQYVAGLIVAISGLIGSIALLRKTPPEIQKQLDAINAHQTTIEDKLDASAKAQAKKREESYEAELKQRNWLSDVLDRLSVKVTDPPGTTPHDAIDFYAPPKSDPHKVSGAHLVQPKDPMPLPAEP